MSKGLFELIVSRYWKIITLMFVIVLGIAFSDTSRALQSWQSTKDYLQTKEGQTDFAEGYLDGGQEVYEYFDVETGDYKETQEFEIYRQDMLQFFNTGVADIAPYGNGSNYYHENTFVFIIVAGVLGFLLFFYDLKSKFNTLLFSSRYSRKDIYWMKYLVVGTSFTLAALLGKAYALIMIKSSLPVGYFNADIRQLALEALANTCLLVVIFIVSSFAGLILGEWVTGVLTIVGFGATLWMFLQGVNELSIVFNYYVLNNKNVENTMTNPLESFSILGFKNIKIPLWYFAVYLVLANIFLISGYYLFQTLSLEKNGHYLLFDKLKKPTLIVFMLYCGVVFSGAGIANHLYSENIEFNGWVEIVKLTIILSLAYLIGSITIYRKLKIGKKTLFVFNKVA